MPTAIVPSRTATLACGWLLPNPQVLAAEPAHPILLMIGRPRLQLHFLGRPVLALCPQQSPRAGNSPRHSEWRGHLVLNANFPGTLFSVPAGAPFPLASYTSSSLSAIEVFGKTVNVPYYMTEHAMPKVALLSAAIDGRKRIRC